jgi:hypothetical protein
MPVGKSFSKTLPCHGSVFGYSAKRGKTQLFNLNIKKTNKKIANKKQNFLKKCFHTTERFSKTFP